MPDDFRRRSARKTDEELVADVGRLLDVDPVRRAPHAPALELVPRSPRAAARRFTHAARWFVVGALFVALLQATGPSFAAALETAADRVETVAPPLAQGLDALALLMKSFPPTPRPID